MGAELAGGRSGPLGHRQKALGGRARNAIRRQHCSQSASALFGGAVRAAGLEGAQCRSLGGRGDAGLR